MKTKLRKIIIVIIIMLLVFSIFIIYNNKKQTTNVSIGVNKKEFLVQDLLTYREIEDETITKELSKCESIENGNLILLEYTGNKESVIVPKELDGSKIEKIDSKAFETDRNLEMIKIPVEIAKNTEKIEGFEESESLSNEEYTGYITTKEYNEEYLKYIKLTEEEKEKQEIEPARFVNTDKVVANDKETIVANATLPSKFDLRDRIDISSDHPENLELDYAYAITKLIENNLALTKGITKNLSEIHLAVMTEQYSNPVSMTIWTDKIKNYRSVEEVSNTLLSEKYLLDNYNKDETSRFIYNACINKNYEIDQTLKTRAEALLRTQEPETSYQVNDSHRISQGQDLLPAIVNNGGAITHTSCPFAMGYPKVEIDTGQQLNKYCDCTLTDPRALAPVYWI